VESTTASATATPTATGVVVPLTFSRLQEFIDAEGLQGGQKHETSIPIRDTTTQIISDYSTR
jgi:hypothetical protein